LIVRICLPSCPLPLELPRFAQPLLMSLTEFVCLVPFRHPLSVGLTPSLFVFFFLFIAHFMLPDLYCLEQFRNVLIISLRFFSEPAWFLDPKVVVPGSLDFIFLVFFFSLLIPPLLRTVGRVGKLLPPPLLTTVFQYTFNWRSKNRLRAISHSCFPVAYKGAVMIKKTLWRLLPSLPSQPHPPRRSNVTIMFVYIEYTPSKS